MTDTQQQIIALKTKNPAMTTREIGKVVDVNASTVTRTLRKYNINAKRMSDYKVLRADIFAGMQDNVLSSITKEDLNKASIRDKTIFFGTLYDKERLERGKSTQNIALSSIVEEIDAEESRERKQSIDANDLQQENKEIIEAELV